MIRYLIADRLRLVLAILAITWGTTAVGFMLAVGEGLRLHFIESMQSFGQNILVVFSGVVSMPSYSHATGDTVKLTHPVWRQLKQQLPENMEISREYQSQSELRYQGTDKSISTLAAEPNYQALRHITVKPGGRFINALDVEKKRRVIVLGHEIAATIFPAHINPVGQWVVLALDEARGEPYQVIGVSQPKVQLESYTWPFDNQQTWIPAATYEALKKPQTITDIVIYPNTPDIRNQVRTVVAAHQQLNPNDEGIVNFFDTKEIQRKTKRFFTGFQLFFGAIGVLTLLIAGASIANVMFIIVKKSTPEIGLRMAVGAQPRQIMLSYFAGAMLIIIAGGILGLVLIKLGIHGWQHLTWLKVVSAELGDIKPQLSPLVLTLVILVLAIVGIAAGLLPAMRAARVEPVVALRSY